MAILFMSLRVEIYEHALNCILVLNKNTMSFINKEEKKISLVKASSYILETIESRLSYNSHVH